MRVAPVLAALGAVAVLVALSRRASAAAYSPGFVDDWTPGSSPPPTDEIAALDAQSAALQRAEAAAQDDERAAIRRGDRAAEMAAQARYSALRDQRSAVESRRTELRLAQ